jgi:hypothetical protein
MSLLRRTIDVCVFVSESSFVFEALSCSGLQKKHLSCCGQLVTTIPQTKRFCRKPPQQLARESHSALIKKKSISSLKVIAICRSLR